MVRYPRTPGPAPFSPKILVEAQPWRLESPARRPAGGYDRSKGLRKSRGPMSNPPRFTFVASSSGTNLIRTTMVAGRRLQLNTGHGYYRPHTNPAGVVTDLQTSGLTPDQVETAIALDVH